MNNPFKRKPKKMEKKAEPPKVQNKEKKEETISGPPLVIEPQAFQSLQQILDNRYLLQHIYSFLTIEETAKARRICKKFYNSLRRVTVHSGPLMNREDGQYDDPWKLYYSIPLTTSIPKRIGMRIDWVDQGWGNKKGCIRVQLMREGKNIASDYPFGVCEHTSSIRNKVYDSEKLDTSSSWSNPSDLLTKARIGDVLEIWRIIGGGGGHQLSIREFLIVLETSP